jgi:hypothetical protein
MIGYPMAIIVRTELLGMPGILIAGRKKGEREK